LIVIGLYAQAKEFLAVHRDAVERPYRSDAGALPPIRLGRWGAWMASADADAEAVGTRSRSIVVDLDRSLVPEVSRVRRATGVRWASRGERNLHVA